MADKPQNGECVVISVLLEGPEIAKLNSKLLAERIHRCCQGEALPSINAQEGAEYRSCDGINIMNRVCIGSSKK
jgi:hypothetical protein